MPCIELAMGVRNLSQNFGLKLAVAKPVVEDITTTNSIMGFSYNSSQMPTLFHQIFICHRSAGSEHVLIEKVDQKFELAG